MIKQRSRGMQVVLYILTLGLHSFHRFHVTSGEMIEHRELDRSAGFRAVLLAIPLLHFITCWKHGGAVEALSEGRYNQPMIFLGWLMFSPVVRFLTQRELNAPATA